jgi:drug/metabolite transporter (DMT)-like permease
MPTTSTAPASASISEPFFAELRGVLCGLGAALIWGLWPVLSKFGVRETMSAGDIAALRFSVAGVLLLPVLIRERRSLPDWRLALILALGAGAPYTLVSVSGLVWAPASQAGVILPSCSMLFSFLGAWLILSDRPTRQGLIGIILLSCGIALVGWDSLVNGARGGYGEAWRGDLLFVGGGFLWACYTVAFRRSGLKPLVATALTAVLSLILYVPLYVIWTGARVLKAPLSELALQAVFQGVFAAIVALLLHSAAVAALGARRAAVFPGLAPAVAVAMSALILREHPGWWEYLGLVLVTTGMLVTLGLRWRPLQRRMAEPRSAVSLE